MQYLIEIQNTTDLKSDFFLLPDNCVTVRDVFRKINGIKWEFFPY